MSCDQEKISIHKFVKGHQIYDSKFPTCVNEVRIPYPYDPSVDGAKETVAPVNGSSDRRTVVHHPPQLEGREIRMNRETTSLLGRGGGGGGGGGREEGEKKHLKEDFFVWMQYNNVDAHVR